MEFKGMKILGKKKIWMLIVLVLIVVIVARYKIGSLIQASYVNWKVPDDQVEILEEYLLSNYSIVNLKDDKGFADLSILDSDLEGKEIFFTGEHHGVRANEELKMKFLKYFKEKTDFKYYLCEMAYSKAYFINKYLETGDIKNLEYVYKPLKGTFGWTKDSYNHWKDLYEYNETLPIDKRIQVVGIDIEHQISNAYIYLADVLPEREVPKEIQEKIEGIIDLFNDVNNFYNGLAVEYSRELLKDIEEKENIYREYLGDDFFGFKLVNLNVLNRDEAYSLDGNNYEWSNTRDRMLYENFKMVYSELARGKFYGQWGLSHVLQSEEDGVMWFAAHLNSEESIFKDKVLSIAYYYDDCQQMSKRRIGEYSVSKLNYIPSTIKRVNDLIDSHVNIYKIDGAGSPFYEVPMKSSFTGKELEEKVADFFQYIVCIKKSKGTEPLNDEYN